MLLISESEVRSRISPEEASVSVRAAHRDLASGAAQNVVRARARSGRFTLHSLPSLSNTLGLSGIKVYSSIGGMKASHLLVYSVGSGELVAMIEAQELGRLRTAAAAILGAEILSRGALGKVLIIGSGYQGEGLVRALVAERDRLGIKRITLTSRDKNSGIARASLLSSLYGEQIFYSETTRGDFETIFTATTASSPVLTKEDLTRENSPQTVKQIVALGSNSLIRRELDGRLLTGAEKIVTDDREVSKAESGNLLPLIEAGLLNWNQVFELGEFLTARGAYPPRRNSAGYSIFLSHGLGVQDLYLGALLLA